MKKFINWLKSPKSDFVIFIAVLILANIAGSKAYLRWDLTQPKSYSISKASESLVKNLQEPLSVRVFFDKNLPSPYNSVAQYVEDFLEEYKAAAGKNFSVAYMDVSKDENIELAREFGLRQVQIQEVKNNEVGFKQSYMGIVISYGDSIELLDPVSSAEGFEYKLTSTISKMINTADSLAGLGKDERISLTVYLSSAIKSLRISGADQIEPLVQSAFNTVNAQKQGRLDFKTVNPDEEEVDGLIEKYGIQGISYRNADGQTETGVLGVVLESGENFRVLPIQIQQSLFGYGVAGLDSIEEDLNESIKNLVSKPTKIGYIIGHNELPLDQEKYAGNFDQLVSGLYELEEIDLNEADIPGGMTSIVINGPQWDYTEEELYKVDQFLMRGGNIMFFIDGFNSAGEAAQYTNQPQYSKNTVNLDRLLNKWGVKRGQDMVLDKNCYQQNSNQYGKVNLYWVPVLQKNQMSKNHPITKNLGYVTMLENSSLDVTAALADSDVKTTILANSSDEAWLQESVDFVLNPMAMYPPDASKMGSVPLAVLIEGNFESAFDQAPASENEEEAPADDSISTSTHLAKSRLPGKIFVTGSSYITTYQVLDASGQNPVAMFVMNTVDYMNGNEDLCTMRTKGLSLNTLTIKSQGFAKFVQYFNEYGLAVLVALAGLLVWRARSRRKVRINKKYNPDDTRTITKKEKPAKAKDKAKSEE